jgi:hypothetical protein
MKLNPNVRELVAEYLLETKSELGKPIEFLDSQGSPHTGAFSGAGLFRSVFYILVSCGTYNPTLCRINFEQIVSSKLEKEKVIK